ncbi:MAG: potassium channel protein [Candidatus Aminicenantes bacterium]|nr:potassium channel protein [Candidatus Aminicenantes bacterium]
MGARNRILTSLTIFAVVFGLGVAGFKVLGGRAWSILDSVYMTAITIATVGYGEIRDLSANPAARIFTTVYIFLCLGTIAYAVSSITAFVVEGELRNILGRRKMEKAIARLSGHYIVCGGDETAQTIVRELIATRKPFVVVDASAERLARLKDLGDVLSVEADPSDDEVLRRAGIERAKGIICSLPTDEANLFVTVTARGLNPGLRIVAKGTDVKSHPKMKKAGADAVISPTFIGGMRMVSEMIRPAVTTFLDLMLRERERVLRFDEVAIPAGSRLAGRTIAEVSLEIRTGALLVAVRRGGSKEFAFNPPQTSEIAAGDVLVFIGTPEMAAELEQLAAQA